MSRVTGDDVQLTGAIYDDGFPRQTGYAADVGYLASNNDLRRRNAPSSLQYPNGIEPANIKLGPGFRVGNWVDRNPVPAIAIVFVMVFVLWLAVTAVSRLAQRR